MKKNRIHKGRIAGSVVGCCMLAVLPAAGVSANGLDHGGFASENPILHGYAISPIPSSKLNLTGKNWVLVGLGSYIVNTSGCNDCHTHKAYALGGDPFKGEPEQINVEQYLAGGRTFPPSPFVSANLTPDASGKPAGLTFEQFRTTLRTGHNPLDPPGMPLQIMPWPVYGKKTDTDLRAIYEYLRAIPSLPDNPNPGPEP